MNLIFIQPFTSAGALAQKNRYGYLLTRHLCFYKKKIELSSRVQ